MKILFFLSAFLFSITSFAKLEKEAQCLYQLEDIMSYATPSDYAALSISTGDGISGGTTNSRVTKVSEEGLYVFTSALTLCPFKDEDLKKNKQFPKIKIPNSRQLERGVDDTEVVSRSYIIQPIDETNPLEISIDFPLLLSLDRSLAPILAHPKVNSTTGVTKNAVNTLECKQVKDSLISSRLEKEFITDLNTKIKSLQTTYDSNEYFYWDLQSITNIEKKCGAVKGVDQTALKTLVTHLEIFYYKANPEEATPPQESKPGDSNESSGTKSSR